MIQFTTHLLYLYTTVGILVILDMNHLDFSKNLTYQQIENLDINVRSLNNASQAFPFTFIVPMAFFIASRKNRQIFLKDVEKLWKRLKCCNRNTATVGVAAPSET